MENKNATLLFEYLKSILYDDKVIDFDINQLDESHIKLGQGFQVLEKQITEMKEYLKNISNGNLSTPVPDKDNFLCHYLKNLHARLNHITWQAKQVAKGDYLQHVAFLGEFSDSFNTMTEQLKQREKQLKEEAIQIKNRAEVIEKYNQLIVELTKRINEYIFVVDKANKQVLYCNHFDHHYDDSRHRCNNCQFKHSIHKELIHFDCDDYVVWEKRNDCHYYRITSFPIEWLGRSSIAHIIEDVTEDQKAKQNLAVKAYRDYTTGIYNRLFFSEYIEKLLKEKQIASICYFDLDGLKHVNDTYGHIQGDKYLQRFVDVIKKYIRSSDIFARLGGDEFSVSLIHCHEDLAYFKLKKALKEFVEDNREAYPASFSFGIVEINAKKAYHSLEEIIKDADEQMYRHKQKNRKIYKHHKRKD